LQFSTLGIATKRLLTVIVAVMTTMPTDDTNATATVREAYFLIENGKLQQSGWETADIDDRVHFDDAVESGEATRSG
jgi:hypothetical protein